MDVLGIEVDAELVRLWARWLAPPAQPFFLTEREVRDLALTPETRAVPDALRETFQVWNVSPELPVVWLDEAAFGAQSRPARADLVRAQAGHRRGAVPSISDWADLLDPAVLEEQAGGPHFLWWPSLLTPPADAVLARFVTEEQQPCRRAEVPPEIWAAAGSVLPRARALAGTFTRRGGANCFATVMAAAGVEDVEDVEDVAETLMPQPPFEAWLNEKATVGGADDEPGTVLVWRNSDGLAQHSAVTIGGGWALHKGGEDWICPRQVITVQDLIRTAPPGVTLHRYRIQ